MATANKNLRNRGQYAMGKYLEVRSTKYLDFFYVQSNFVKI